MRWLRDEGWMLYNKERPQKSRGHKSLDPISILSIPHKLPKEALRDKRQANRRRQVIKLNCLLHFVNFSLIVLLLLRIHFLQNEN